MAGYGRVVVGWRYNDRRRYRPDEMGHLPRMAGPCIGCGDPTYLLNSGIAAIREKDAEIICDLCYQRDKHLVQEAL